MILSQNIITRMDVRSPCAALLGKLSLISLSICFRLIFLLSWGCSFSLPALIGIARRKSEECATSVYWFVFLSVRSCHFPMCLAAADSFTMVLIGLFVRLHQFTAIFSLGIFGQFPLFTGLHGLYYHKLLDLLCVRAAG